MKNKILSHSERRDTAVHCLQQSTESGFWLLQAFSLKKTHLDYNSFVFLEDSAFFFKIPMNEPWPIDAKENLSRICRHFFHC